MKTKHFILPTIWAVSSFLVGAQTNQPSTNQAEKKPPNRKGQEILDLINQDRTSLHTPEGQLDPEEIAHLQRMIRLYELRAGFTDVDTARKNLMVPASETSEAVAQQSESSSSESELKNLRDEVANLRQQLQNFQPQNSPSQNNSSTIDESAGAQHPPSDWRENPYRYYRRYRER